jgi:hypothetical protein
MSRTKAMPTKMKARTTRKSRSSYRWACDLLGIESRVQARHH